jgi:hypothetical protein
MFYKVLDITMGRSYEEVIRNLQSICKATITNSNDPSEDLVCVYDEHLKPFVAKVSDKEVFGRKVEHLRKTWMILPNYQKYL